jgi:hypothetical protein
MPGYDSASVVTSIRATAGKRQFIRVFSAISDLCSFRPECIGFMFGLWLAEGARDFDFTSSRV